MEYEKKLLKIKEIARWMSENNVTDISCDGNYCTVSMYNEDTSETNISEFVV